MSRTTITSDRSRTLSQEGDADGAHDQSARLDDHPTPQNDVLPPADDEEEDYGPSVVQMQVPSGISNSRPPQPPEPHIQGHTSDDSPGDGGLTAKFQNEMQEDQPSPSEIVDVMKQVLKVLKESTIASKSGNDDRSRFWELYKRVAEEHDDDFLERYNSDMDIVLVFSGLFSAVSTTFIVAMEPNLSPDPNDTTHALLTQLVQIGLGNFTAAGSTPVAPASTWSPSTTNIRIQSIAYASLSFSLLAAFGAVLGKQWLGYYKSHRYGRGSQEERAKRRQEKFDGIVAWYFDAVVQSFPVLLQISLLLFGIALSANMWFQQHTIAWVIIATTVFGFMFYSLTVMAALVSPACPFQTPISTILRMMRIDRILRPTVKVVFQYVKKSITFVHTVLRWLFFVLLLLLVVLFLCFDTLRSSCTKFYHDHISSWLRSFVSRTPTTVVDPEAQPPGQNLDVVAANQYLIKLKLQDTPTSSLEAPSIMWLIETSTDPEVFLAAASLVPYVDWPLDLDLSDTLHQLYDVYTSCLDIQRRIAPSLEEKASACTMALCHLYCNRILQGHPTYEFLSEGSTDYGVFHEMFKRTEVNELVATIKLVIAKNGSPLSWSSPKFGTCPDTVLKRLSHVLPFHFVIGQVDEDVEKLAMTVVSGLLRPTSSPSPQIIANCTLLACVMVGVQFDEKDIVRVDKSSAMPRLAQSLWAQFQNVLRASGGSDLDSTIRQTPHFDVICQVLDCDLPELRPPSEMWNLGVWWKMYSRARSSEQNDRISSVQRLRFTVNRTRPNLAVPAARTAFPALQALQARAARALRAVLPTLPALQARTARALRAALETRTLRAALEALETFAAIAAIAPLPAIAAITPLPAFVALAVLAARALRALRVALEALATLPVLEAPASPSSPAWLWQHQILWQENSHLPEDFDWLVDYLTDVPSNDHATAGDILVLLSSMRVRCSPAKERLYIKKLIACMDSSMPARLRHAALRAAHNSREALASIDVADDTDMVLTEFSLAILSAVCPHPDATPTEDGPDCSFHRDRDLCYLELISVLDRNPVWHSHLFGDGHIQRCHSIITKLSESNEPENRREI